MPMTPDDLAEKVARAIWDCTPRRPSWDEGTLIEPGNELLRTFREATRAEANAAIDAIPGVRDVVEGRAVVVPREATPEMHMAGATTVVRRGNSRSLTLYRAMLASSPYAPAKENRDG